MATPRLRLVSGQAKPTPPLVMRALALLGFYYSMAKQSQRLGKDSRSLRIRTKGLVAHDRKLNGEEYNGHR